MLLKAVLLMAGAGALAFAAFVAIADEDKPESGLQPGEALPVYNVMAVAGPEAGRTLCYT
jgi:hypothetical protein